MTNKNFDAGNLNAVYFDEDMGIYELEFLVDGEMAYIKVDAEDHEEAAIDENYFEDDEIVNKIIAENDIEEA